MDTNTATSFESIFGPESRGNTAEERARTSRTEYVRSQVQLALDSNNARGVRLSAAEALEAFGLDILRKVAQDGATPLIWSVDEPAATIKNRRTQIGISLDKLARECGLSIDVVKAAETPGSVTAIRSLQRIAQALALDEVKVGYSPNAGGDRGLGVRLRELTRARDETRFSESVVLKLTEAAWVIARQASLGHFLKLPGFNPIAAPDPNFSYPTWQQGYRLAEQTRNLLELREDEPISSLRNLLERKLKIPLVQQALGLKFAGATLANGQVRGIVINEEGLNQNVWVRRMTMCHELGHLLWDPDQQLNKLNVDAYDDLQSFYFEEKRDPVEIRANAFAIAFLAPPKKARQLFESEASDTAGIAQVMQIYGVSATAAKYHIQNAIGRKIEPRNADLPHPSDEWKAVENLAVDYFPIANTPISRRGLFAWMVAKGYANKQLSADTAAALLLTTPSEIEARYKTILAEFE